MESYIEAKYSAGGPGSDRFDPNANEVHASQLSDCQRKRYWKHDNGHRAEPSPYFELGRVFELLYGAALAFEHDPDITQDDLKRYKPWEVAERSTRVRQDVEVTIHLDGCHIVGECDWVVFEDDLGFDAITVHHDGARTVHGGAEPGEYRGNVEKVVETKTKKDLSWVDRKGPDRDHMYQVYPYMHALQCPGELAYMERNDFSELVVPLRLDDDVWTDCVLRAMRHSANMRGDEVPAATPLNDDECHWCDFKEACAQRGGSPHL